MDYKGMTLAKLIDIMHDVISNSSSEHIKFMDKEYTKSEIIKCRQKLISELEQQYG